MDLGYCYNSSSSLSAANEGESTSGESSSSSSSLSPTRRRSLSSSTIMASSTSTSASSSAISPRILLTSIAVIAFAAFSQEISSSSFTSITSNIGIGGGSGFFPVADAFSSPSSFSSIISSRSAKTVHPSRRSFLSSSSSTTLLRFSNSTTTSITFAEETQQSQPKQQQAIQVDRQQPILTYDEDDDEEEDEYVQLAGPNQRRLVTGVKGDGTGEECIVALDSAGAIQQQQTQQMQPAITTQPEIDLHGLEELAPLERQMLRMEGLEPYVLVSVLSSTTSYGTITGTAILKNGAIDVLSTFLLATSTVSTVCGVYSTVVFSMCILYGKTALGLDKEDAYYYFMEATSLQRFRGFKAFSYSLLLFVIDIFLIGVDKMPDDYQLAGGITATLITIFGYFEFDTILEGAAPMFTGVIPGTEEEGEGDDDDDDDDE